MTTNVQNISAVILAGGQGSRLKGVDKGWVELNKIPLVQHVINRIKPQVSEIIISANRNIEDYQQFGFPVFTDDISGYAGPLAGIFKALQRSKSEWLLTVPADSPFIPTDLTQHLAQDVGDSKIIIVHDGERLQPTFALIHKELASSLQQFLDKGERKTRAWMLQQPYKMADFSQAKNAFMNINTEDDLKTAEQHFTAFMA